MYLKRLWYLLVLPLFMLAPVVYAGDAESIKTMANIMIHLNHYPSDSEKSKLQTIADNSKSQDIRIIAIAIKDLRHTPSSADKVQLQKVMDDKQASHELKQLASIVYHVHHHPNSDAKKQLSTMINFASDYQP